jgi:hypothetical protein
VGPLSSSHTLPSHAQGTAYNGAGYVTLWQTNTGSQQPTPVPGTPSYLTSGNSLAVNQYLLSPQVRA